MCTCCRATDRARQRVVRVRDGQICPDSFTDGNFWKTGRSNVVVVTSLATGVVGGQTLIAVGLSDYGIYIYNQNLQLVVAPQLTWACLARAIILPRPR